MNDTFNSKDGEQNIAQGRNAIGKQINNFFCRLLGRISTQGSNSPAIQAGGNVAVTYGLSADDAVKLAKELAAGQLAAKDEQIKALTEAITALARTGAPAANIQAAEQALQHGDTEKAKAIFAEVLKTKEAEGKQAIKEAAAAARHLGALAFLHDTNGALAAYRKAVELAPDNADGWNMLGHLLRRTGELTQAEDAYHKVLALGEEQQDKDWQAKAIGNFGIVYGERGELDKAETMFRKSLDISEALELKEATAKLYGNLGLLYRRRGDLVKAEEMHRKSLAISEPLSHKEVIAANYNNLGIVYEQRGNLDQAESAWKNSLRLFQEMNMPDAKKVQQWLDDLAQQRGR